MECVKETINKMEEMEMRINKYEKKHNDKKKSWDDLHQYGRSNCFFVHGSKEATKRGKYPKNENYIGNILTFILPVFPKWNKISRRLQTILLDKFKLGFVLPYYLEVVLSCQI